jgi:hypothetical protein
VSSNFRHVLRHLPVKSPLVRDFLSKRGFDPGADFDWNETEPALARRLSDLIGDLTDDDVRQALIADLEKVGQLSDPSGERQMRTVSGGNLTIIAAMEQLHTSEERALWLFEHHPDRFDDALEARFFDEQSASAWAQTHDLRIKQPLDRSAEAQAALKAAISAFYRQREGCGYNVLVELIDRHLEGTVQVTVYVADLPNHRTEFEHGELTRRRSTPVKDLALNYNPATGIARTVVRGGKDYHMMFAASVSEHLLHHKIKPERVQPQRYRLSVLRGGISVQDPAALGLECVRLRGLTLWDPDTNLYADFKAPARTRNAVMEQIQKAFPQPGFWERWVIIGAQICLHFFPEAGRQQGRKLTLRFNRNGECNLHSIGEADRALVEPLLIEWGLVDAPKVTRVPDPRGPANDPHMETAA